MPSDDPSEWLPVLLSEDWVLAVEDLLAAGKDVPVKEPPIIAGAHQKASGGGVQNQGRVKVYRPGDTQSQPQSWGDTDRDLVTQVAIDLQAAGARAVPIARSFEIVVDRILSRHRVYPQASWERFESWRSANPVTYSDGQRVVFTVTLARRGEVMPEPLKAR